MAFTISSAVVVPGLYEAVKERNDRARKMFTDGLISEADLRALGLGFIVEEGTRYDDKIDAMYEAEYDLPHSVRDQQISWAWFERVDQQDKRNTERLAAYEDTKAGDQ